MIKVFIKPLLRRCSIDMYALRHSPHICTMCLVSTDPLSCKINGYLVLTREANALLSLSHLGCGTSSSATSLHTVFMQVTSPTPGCTRRKCLSGEQSCLHWTALAVFCMATAGFIFVFVCMDMCTCVCMCVCPIYSSMHSFTVYSSHSYENLQLTDATPKQQNLCSGSLSVISPDLQRLENNGMCLWEVYA